MTATSISEFFICSAFIGLWKWSPCCSASTKSHISLTNFINETKFKFPHSTVSSYDRL